MEKIGSIRIAIAEDHHLVRSALIALLEREPDLEVVGDAADGPHCLPLIERTRPHVFIMDAEMPDHRPADFTRMVRRCYPDVSVLVLTAHLRPQYVVSLLQAGAAGYVLKDDPPGTLTQAIRSVAEGLDWVSPRVATVLMASSQIHGNNHKIELTGREREILLLMAQGLRNAEIAAALGIAEKTVKNHATRLFRKLGVQSRVEAVLLAVEAGLVSVDDE